MTLCKDKEVDNKIEILTTMTTQVASLDFEDSLLKEKEESN